jgi:hypothetical protein
MRNWRLTRWPARVEQNIKHEMLLCTGNDLRPKLEVRVAFHICDANAADAVGQALWKAAIDTATETAKKGLLGH